MKVFDTVSLNKELNNSSEKYSSPFIQYEIQEKLGEPNYALNNNFKVIFSHDVDWVTSFEPVSIFKSFKQTFASRRKYWFSIAQLFKPGKFTSKFEQLLQLEQDKGISAFYFFLSGGYGVNRYSNRYSLSWKSAKNLVDLVKSGKGKIGLHGSYYADENNSYADEKNELEQAAGVSINSHRNHYLKFNPVSFWENLENAGIKYDFTVGYSSVIGFRAGLCSMYNPYNFITKSKSDVFEIPLIYMERPGHIKNFKTSLKEIENALTHVKNLNGCVSILFHPESFVVDHTWFQLYKEVIDLAVYMGADVSGNLPSAK